MIDDHDVKELNKLHPKNKRVACLNLSDKGLAIVHSPYFVLEVPLDAVKVQNWPHDPYDGVRQWRYEKAPQTSGEPAQVMRVTWEDDDEGALEVVQLVSENAERFMRLGFYEFFTSILVEPSFRLYKEEINPDGGMSNIGIFSEGKLVGAVTPLLKKAPDEEPENETAAPVH